jgi:hypothetical protein
VAQIDLWPVALLVVEAMVCFGGEPEHLIA